MAGRTGAIPPVSDYAYTDGGYPGGERRGGGGHRWIPWVLGLVLVLGVVIGVAYYLLAGGKTYSVPLVNGEPVATAQTQITAQHLRSTVVSEASSSVKTGLVIKSTPAEGNIVAANTLVTLYVSSGTAPVAVPNVVGEQQSTAESALTSKGFQVRARRTDLNRARGPGDQPESQRRHGGAWFHRDDHRLRRSDRGALGHRRFPGHREPDPDHGRVRGQRPAGLRAGPVRQGTVFNQFPANGANAAKGSTVIIYVQNGASPSPSPTVSPTVSPTPSDTFSLGM